MVNSLMSKKILLGLVSVFFVLIAALLVIPSFIDWSQYKDQIRTQIEESTGYELTLNGPLRAAFLPYPHATVENVSVNSGTSEGPYAFNATVDKASVSLALLPLLGGNIVVDDIKLVNPVIDVQQRAVAPTSEETPQQQDTQDDKGQAPNIQINGLNLQGAKITYKALNAEPMTVQIPTLDLQADTLKGPFDFNGSVIYQAYSLSLKGDTGAYSTTEAFPVKIAINENTNGLYSVEFSGIADLTNGFGAQGEAKVKTKSIAATLAQIKGGDKGIGDQSLALQGLVTVTPQSVKIDNGSVELGSAKGSLAFDVTGLEKGAAKNITAQVDFSSPVDLDGLLKTSAVATKTTTPKTASDTAATTSKTTYAFLPETIEIPSQMAADISLKAPEIKYKGQTVKNAAMRAVLKDNAVTAAIVANELPGGGAVNLDAAMKSESSSRNGTTGATVLSNPSFQFSGKLDLKSLKTVGVDWLGVVPADMIAKEGMPQSVSGDIKGLISGPNITFASPALKLDNQPPLNVSLTYKNAAKPSVNVALSGDRFIVPKGLIPEQAQSKTKTVDPKAVPVATPKASAKADATSPMDIGFDVQLGELVFDDKIMQKLTAKGSLRGDALTLSPLTIGNFAGTSLSANGTIANIKTLDGLNIAASVDSQGIDTFLKTFNVALPDAVPQPIGAVKGSVKAEGNKALVNVDVKGNVYGFTINANGQLSEPMDKGFMPKSFNVALSHPNAARAVETLKKDFKAGEGLQRPLAFKSAITSEGDVIQLTNLDIKLGDMTATGSMNVNTKSKTPSIAADLNFGTLDTKALLGGGKSQGNPATAGNAASPTPAGGSPWTRDALNTDWIRSMNLKLNAKAVKLVHGPWEVLRPVINVDLKDGVLTVNDISGTMFDGTMTMTGKASATAAGQPLTINAAINAENVNLSPFVQAALGQNKERVRGKGSLDLTLETKGVSSSALAFALNGNGHIKTSNFTIIGIDLGRVTQAVSGDVLSGLGSIVDDAFNGGSTAFKPVDHKFQIREGTMPVENFTMQSDTASLVSNGTISFSRWQMDLTNAVKITEPEEMPVVTLVLRGPLNAPQKTVQADIVKDFIMRKYGTKIQNKIQKELGDGVGGQLLQNLLGIPQQQQPQAAPQVAPTPANDGAAPQEAQPQPEAAPAAPQPSVEEQVIRGLFDKLAR